MYSVDWLNEHHQVIALIMKSFVRRKSPKSRLCRRVEFLISTFWRRIDKITRKVIQRTFVIPNRIEFSGKRKLFQHDGEISLPSFFFDLIVFKEYFFFAYRDVFLNICEV